MRLIKNCLAIFWFFCISLPIAGLLLILVEIFYSLKTLTKWSSKRQNLM
jgi:hypothetical protein